MKVTCYKEIWPGEEGGIAYQLVMDCFCEFVASGCRKEGIIEFSKYVDPELIRLRLLNSHFIILAPVKSDFVGMIEVWNINHISLLSPQPIPALETAAPFGSTIAAPPSSINTAPVANDESSLAR